MYLGIIKINRFVLNKGCCALHVHKINCKYDSSLFADVFDRYNKSR